MFDAAIIGAGPAGLSAALTLALHNKSLLWFGSASEKIEKAEKIANYPGLGLVTGAELNRRFAEHAAALGLAPVDKLVTNIMPAQSGYMLLAENEIYEARTLLLATGAAAAKGLPGERELLGRGVSYCATCDGFLYKGKRVAVLCASPRYEHEAAALAELAGELWFFPLYQGAGLRGENVRRAEKPLARILGEKRVAAVALSDGTELPMDGVFCLRSAVAPAALLPGLAMDGPHIAVDRSMAASLPGCFAAGDCTGRPYQIAKAVGEGCAAAHSMAAALAKNRI